MSRNGIIKREKRNKMRTIKSAVILATLLMPVAGYSADHEDRTATRIAIAKLGDLGKAAETTGGGHADISGGTAVSTIVASNVTVQPGATANLGQVPVNFGGSASVAVAILLSSQSTLTGSAIFTGWAGPGQFFTITSIINGDTLSDAIGGGAVVPVYGPALNVWVFNGGTAPITITQLTVYSGN